MRQDDLFHRPRGEDCWADGQGGFVIRLRARRGACERVTLVYNCNKYEWLRGQQRLEMPRVLQDSAFDYYAAHIRGNDTRLAYIFEVEAQDGRWYFSEEGPARQYDHKLGYFNFFQFSFVHDCDVFRPLPWVQSGCVYQIFPERFCNGLGKKDYVTCAWDAEPTPKSFYGGDLVGVRQKLDELAELGVNCLYLTPVFVSPSNHKYDIVDYMRVDPAFGGDEALRALVRDAHARGMRVLLDGVFNHCSSQNALFQDVVKKGRASPYYDWFFIDGERPDEKKGNYQTFAAVRGMPKINTGNAGAIDYFCQVAAYWLLEFDADGWRLDVCDEISDRFLRALRQAVKAAKADAVIIGEVWHRAEHWLRGDMLDGVMNYPFTKACLDYVVFGGADAQGFCDQVIRTLWHDCGPAAEMAMNLIGSHDTERFLTRVNGDIERLKMGYAAAFMMPGMVSVYYGDEVGVTGGYDPGCRKGFPWEKEKQNQALRRFIQALYRLKKQPALSRGVLNAYAKNGMAVLERRAEEQAVRLYMNRTQAAQRAEAGLTVAPNTCEIWIEDGKGARALHID